MADLIQQVLSAAMLKTFDRFENLKTKSEKRSCWNLCARKVERFRHFYAQKKKFGRCSSGLEWVYKSLLNFFMSLSIVDIVEGLAASFFETGPGH